jgi:C4-dicarboxylate transporter
MKFIVSAILIILFSFLACLYFPWWSVGIVAFLVSIIIKQGHLASFIGGFISLFLLWGFLSYWISLQNNNILAHRVSLLFFKIDSPFLLIFVTALIGAMVAGFAALTGSFVRKEKAGTGF